MDVNAWLEAAAADAERRGLPELRAMLETLARSTHNLRKADLENSQLPPEGGSHIVGEDPIVGEEPVGGEDPIVGEGDR